MPPVDVAEFPFRAAAGLRSARVNDVSIANGSADQSIWSRAKARWTARSASTAAERFTSTLILISLVVIISMLIPARDRAWNIAVATPVWVRIPRPTTDTLATSAS